jgi:hypothetical protein
MSGMVIGRPSVCSRASSFEIFDHEGENQACHGHLSLILGQRWQHTATEDDGQAGVVTGQRSEMS